MDFIYCKGNFLSLKNEIKIVYLLIAREIPFFNNDKDERIIW